MEEIKQICTAFNPPYNPVRLYFNAKGRSSDLFKFYAFPTILSVAKNVKPFVPIKVELTATGIAQTLTAFPINLYGLKKAIQNRLRLQI